MEEYKKLIEKLESIDATSEYAYEEALLCFFKLHKLPVIYYEIPSGTPLFRARTHFDNVLYKDISQIESPPSSSVSNYARCNKPFQSVFYCSENRPTSFMELVGYWAESRKNGEKIYATIGRWELKKALNAIIIADPDVEDSEFDAYHGAGINNHLNLYSAEDKEKYILFYKFLTSRSRKYAKNDLQTYMITSSYCNLALLHAKGKANAIHYPSVPFKGQGLNYCINKEFIMNKNNIELTFVIRDEFVCYINENNKITFHETELIECKNVDLKNNMIIW